MASVLDDGGEEHKSLMSGSSDPFYHFKDTLEQRISTLDTALQTLETTVKTTDTATSPLYRTQKKNCKKLLKGCESALRDLSATIRVVEQSRANFTHIDDEELGSRRNFCTTVSARLHTLKSSMNSPAITEKLRADELALARTRGGDLGARSKEEHANTDFIHTQQADATMMMRQQDEALTDLDSAVDRVGNLASTINVELSAQNKMIDELGEDLDEAEARMGLVMGKLSKLLKTKDGCQLW
eukprot:CAMPEP_0182453590 /NCGR_PEP_ID=MMETSP1319-20130603/591_1 /TAXON_ID=172717 /ORGANISM="Bolidomonas pacifica, Strain RCC208" /LENGTH=241 /DNA_ID=CAMNT_0024651537 /DNA_START=42 /DNA_END=764 /DNA_ORIENTATION=-